MTALDFETLKLGSDRWSEKSMHKPVFSKKLFKPIGINKILMARGFYTG